MWQRQMCLSLVLLNIFMLINFSLVGPVDLLFVTCN